MLKQKPNTSEVRADQVASRRIQTLKLGLDVHADTIVVVRILENSAPQPAQKFTPARFLAWIKSQLPLAEQVHGCYEAGPSVTGSPRDLLALGVRNLVVQPVCLDERHKGVNHDKSDAKQLALRLDCHVAGNGNNSNAKSNAWPRRGAACCSPRASAKRGIGGKPGAGRNSKPGFRTGWPSGWNVSAACSPR
jgi:hypothetical protein